MAINYLIEECTDHSSRGWSVSLYLIPGEYREDGIPCVATDRQLGNGYPIEVHHGQWYSLGSPGTNYVGASLEDHLRQHEDLWQSIADSWQGTTWNGNNHLMTA